MAKILLFRRVKQAVAKRNNTEVQIPDIEDDISAIINDYSLTPARKHWILENMLMNMDDQLEEYKKELEKAERKLEALVKSAKKDIATAYSEFEADVRGMTHAVKNLTRSSSRQSGSSKKSKISAHTTEHS
ncbi:MAG: hypothetical protein A2075_03980 [Geobacteraceae bacterium GWC2_58_44]|nr:MAG: hypothetical protein A2075_03980 [Geobacteraceae bacterium GWC2_58_44]HBG05938.1 hypothetical protein [Geobacter sp.]